VVTRQVSQLIAQNLPVDVHAVDVVNYIDNKKDISFSLLKPGSKTDYEDNYFNTTLLTNVLHHEEINENIIREAVRIAKYRIIVLETVPEDGSRTEYLRTYANDWFYNRPLHYGKDVPVPGTYELAENWPARFAKYGCELAEPMTNLGIDQKVIRDTHVRYVFNK
jgi:hypothetical protein